MAFEDPNAGQAQPKIESATVPGLNPAANTPLAQPVKSDSGQDPGGIMGTMAKAGNGQAAPAASSGASLGAPTTSGSSGGSL